MIACVCMRVCVYTYMYIYVRVYTYVDTRVHIFTYVHTRPYACLHVCMLWYAKLCCVLLYPVVFYAAASLSLLSLLLHLSTRLCCILRFVSHYIMLYFCMLYDIILWYYVIVLDGSPQLQIWHPETNHTRFGPEEGRLMERAPPPTGLAFVSFCSFIGLGHGV